VSHATFENNSAEHGGGMCNGDYSNAEIRDVLFTNNRANMGGGVSNHKGSYATFTDVTFSHNSALQASDSYGSGGGMLNHSSQATLNSVTFINNSADYLGGGLYNTASSSPYLSNVLFMGNSADLGGAIFNNSSSTPSLVNVMIAGNSANSHGGGIGNWFGSIPSLNHVTITGNSANQNGGGIYLSNDTSVIVSNSILSNNQDGGGTDASAQIHGSTSAITVTYSLVQGGFAGAGNIDSDPLFISPIQPTDAPTTTGDFHLQSTSPALDAGDNSAVGADTTDLDGDGDTTEPLPLDLDGNARFIDAPVADSGNGTAPIVDMGAYEKADGSPTATPTATNTPTPTATPTNPTATPTTPPTGTPIISDVRTSNVRDVSFTVSWLTDIVTSGEVRYGTDPNNLNQTANDTRGSTINDETHYLSLAELLENTTYYFDVISADVTDNNNGMHYSVTTAPTLDVPNSDTIYGQILQADGTPPAVGAIVYITLQDANGAGSASQAALLSALAESNGNWSTNLGNARTEDFSGYFLYSASGDRLSLEALGGSNDSGCQRIDTANDAPSAAIVLDGSLCTTTTWSINIQPSWNHIALPLDPVVPYTTESLCAISQGSNSIDEVDRWHNGGWDGHLCDQTFNNFTLVLGAGYFIRANQADTWTITGTAVTEPVPFELQIGWNSINIPHTDSYTAESLCDEIISQGVTALEIDRWYLGGWDGHICGLSFNDYPIERGTGYFVKTSSSGTVTPSELAGTVTPSELAGKRKTLHLQSCLMTSQQVKPCPCVSCTFLTSMTPPSPSLG
jgi:predicted outer membrane repeat protein